MLESHIQDQCQNLIENIRKGGGKKEEAVRKLCVLLLTFSSDIWNREWYEVQKRTEYSCWAIPGVTLFLERDIKGEERVYRLRITEVGNTLLSLRHICNTEKESFEEVSATLWHTETGESVRTLFQKIFEEWAPRR